MLKDAGSSVAAMTFLHRGPGSVARVAVFPGAWNPPTVAHLEIARAALAHADEVIWVVPRAFPHKDFDGARFEDRCRMIELIARQHEGFSAAVAERGLYSQIAEEARALLGDHTEIALVCGRDAAERIAGWDYAEPDAFDRMIARYSLLVAARTGEYEPAANHKERITRLPMESSWDDVSSSEVRRRILAGKEGEDWRGLVPACITGLVRDLYTRK